MQGNDMSGQPRQTKSPQAGEPLAMPSLVGFITDPEESAAAMTELLKTWLDCDSVDLKFFQEESPPLRVDPLNPGPVRDQGGSTRGFEEDDRSTNHTGLSLPECIRRQLPTGLFEPSSPSGSKLTPKGTFWTNNLRGVSGGDQASIRNGKHVEPREGGNGDGSIIIVLLRHRDSVLGFLQATDRRNDRFDQRSVEIVEQAAQTLARLIWDSRRRAELLDREIGLMLRVSEERCRTLLDGVGVGLIEEDFSEVKKYLDRLKDLGIEDIADYLEKSPVEVARCVDTIVINDASWTTINLYGVVRKDDLASQSRSVVTADGHSLFKKLLTALWEGKRRFHAETVHRSLNGEVKQLSLDWHMTPDDEESWSRIICTIADVTERKRAVDRLNEQLFFFQTLIDTVPTPIFYKDTETRYLGCNRAFEVYSKTKKEDLIGKTVFDLMGDTAKARVHHLADHELLRFPGKRLYESSIDHSDGQKSTHINRKATFVRPDGTSAGIVGVILDITEQKLAEDRLRKSQEELRNLSRHLQSVREEERKAISREVHDQLGQTLTVLQMELALLTKKVRRSQRNLLDGAKQLRERLQEAIQIVRSISARTRPEMLDDLGLVAAIDWQVLEFQKLTGLDCILDIGQAELEMEADLSTALFRILQEALTNVWRHAHATLIRVALRPEDDTLTLEVSDNGKGITEREVNDSMSTGLIGMRERVYPWSGQVTIEGRPNAGTTVRVTVPLKDRERRTVSTAENP